METKNRQGANSWRLKNVDMSNLEKTAELRENLKDKDPAALIEVGTNAPEGASNLQVGGRVISAGLSHTLGNAAFGALMGAMGTFGGLSGPSMGVPMGGYNMGPHPGFRPMGPMGGPPRPMMVH